MRREGSPWQGLGAVVVKELADHFDGVRMVLLGLLTLLCAAVPFIVMYFFPHEPSAEAPFLQLFGPGFLSVSWTLTLLIPLVAIGLGFDSVSGEHSRRTLSRILAQPIYRDALLAGKFIAGLFVLTVNILCLWLLIVGLGVRWLGLPPGLEEFARTLIFVGLAIVYAGVWLALAMLFSVLFRSSATAALLSLGLWLFLSVLWPIIAYILGALVAPEGDDFPKVNLMTGQIYHDPVTEAWQQALARLSPNRLFEDAVAAILSPTTHSLGPEFDKLRQMQGVVADAALPLRESLLIAWPLAVGLVATVIVLFVATYVAFQRQEVRA
jgi:ABC-2 type transport system permease protein